MKRNSRVKRHRLLGFFILYATGVTSLVQGAAPQGWIEVLPRKAQAKAAESYGVLTELSSGYAKDWAAALEVESLFARRSYILAARSREAAQATAEDLYRFRASRLESATEIAENRYPRTPGTDSEALARAGRGFSEYLSPYLASLTMDQLVTIGEALGTLFLSHPDCPPGAFKVLQEAALALEVDDYRDWIRALALGTPQALSLVSFDQLGDRMEDFKFKDHLFFFSELYASRMLLRGIFPAAAAGAWYIDVLHDQVKPPPQLSISSFLRNLQAVDQDLAAELLREDTFYARAYMELATIAWVALSRSDVGFLSYTHENESAYEPLFKLAAYFTDPVPSVSLDYSGILRAELFSEAVRAMEDDGSLLGAYATLCADPPAVEALRLGSRYEKLRHRITGALDSLAQSQAETYQGEGLLPRGLNVEDPMVRLTSGEEWVESGLLYLIMPPLTDTALPASATLEALMDGRALRGTRGALAFMEELLKKSCRRYGVPEEILKIPLAVDPDSALNSAMDTLWLLSVSAFTLADAYNHGEP